VKNGRLFRDTGNIGTHQIFYFHKKAAPPMLLGCAAFAV